MKKTFLTFTAAALLLAPTLSSGENFSPDESILTPSGAIVSNTSILEVTPLCQISYMIGNKKKGPTSNVAFTLGSTVVLNSNKDLVTFTCLENQEIAVFWEKQPDRDNDSVPDKTDLNPDLPD